MNILFGIGCYRNSNVPVGVGGGPRRLPVPGTANLRDVGGYAIAGGATRWRALFRADALHRLGGGGLAQIDDRPHPELRKRRPAARRTR
jgi:hypothetical protein